MSGGLFVTNKNMIYSRFFEERVVDMQKGATRVPVNVLNAFVTQKADDHFSAR
ncbi:hypothetical protein PCH70_08250 [Pseudomonas cichorii JBC1]|nr:hypothetical protein PCH70_08250 [Pseudomonas cichorii JBC1]